MSTLRNLALALALAAFVMLASSVAAADSTSFKVDSYIPVIFRDLSWHASGSGKVLGHDATGQGINNTSSSNADNGSNSEHLTLASQSNYRRITPNDFRQLGLGFQFGYDRGNGNSRSSGGSIRSQSNTYNESNSHCASLSLSPTWDVGRYLKSDFFISTRGSASLAKTISPYSHSYSRSTSHYEIDTFGIQDDYSTSTYTQSGTGRSGSTDFAVAPGWGRVNDGSYGATALYIIEELNKTGAIIREPRYGEMTTLTDTVYWYRNHHIIDSRIQRIQALTAITTYLTSIGVSKDLGPYGCFILQDIWDYYPRTSASLEGFDENNLSFWSAGLPRQFGYRIRALFGYHYDFSKSSSLQSYDGYIQSIMRPGLDGDYQTVTHSDGSSSTYRESWNSVTRPYLSLIAEYYHPLGIRWQLNGMLQIWKFLDPLQRNTSTQNQAADGEYHAFSSESRTRVSDNYETQITGTCIYIVNSRTSASLTGSYYFEQERSVSGQSYDGGPFNYGPCTWHANWQFRISGIIQYRISLPLALVINSSYVDTYAESQFKASYSNSRQADISVTAAVQYDIF